MAPGQSEREWLEGLRYEDKFPDDDVERLTHGTDVLHALRGTSVRLSYTDLLEALRAQGAPVRGVSVLLEQMMRADLVLCTDRRGETWEWGYKDEDFDGGPMYVELV